MFCVYCGTKLPDEARFCFMCGKKVEPADNAENFVAANSGSIDEEGFGIEIQEAPTTNSSEKKPGTPELAIEDGSSKMPTTRSRRPTKAAQTKHQRKTNPASKHAAYRNPPTKTITTRLKKLRLELGRARRPEQLVERDNRNSLCHIVQQDDRDSPCRTVGQNDDTPWIRRRKAALEQEKSDEIAALAALYPDANPAQFCDPTPFEAKSPDITEFIAPAPINGTKPASAESVHYAEGQKRRALANAPFLSPSLQSSQCLQRPLHSACHSTFYLINARTSHVY